MCHCVMPYQQWITLSMNGTVFPSESMEEVLQVLHHLASIGVYTSVLSPNNPNLIHYVPAIGSLAYDNLGNSDWS